MRIKSILMLTISFMCIYNLVLLFANIRAIKRIKETEKKMETQRSLATAPMVSVLVPARDEVENILPCVQSLLSQHYDNFEVIVYDDNSTDGTLDKLLSIQDPRLKVLKGKDVPPGWMGKNWACHNLAKHAKGDYLIFVDADTVAKPSMLPSTMSFVLEHNIKAGSGIPTEDMKSFGELITVPFMYWGFLAIFPYFLSNRIKLLGGFSLAVGQFMVFEKNFYHSLGGHAAVKSAITEDVALASLVRRSGEPFFLFRLGDLLHCRMYKGISDAAKGFSRSYGAVFGYRWSLTLVACIWLTCFALMPVFLFPTHTTWSIRVISANLLVWIGVVGAFDAPWVVAFLSPLVYITSGFFLVYGSYLAQRGNLEWKGRSALDFVEQEK